MIYESDYMHGRAMEWEGVEKEELVLKEEGGGAEGVDLRKLLFRVAVPWKTPLKDCLCGLSSKPTPFANGKRLRGLRNYAERMNISSSIYMYYYY